MPCRGMREASLGNHSSNRLHRSYPPCTTSPTTVHKRFSSTTHAQRGGGFGQQQLEKAVRAINRIIFDYEARRTRLKAEAAAKGGPPVVEAPIRGQLVTFRASARHERMIKVRTFTRLRITQQPVEMWLHAKPTCVVSSSGVLIQSMCVTTESSFL